MRRCRKEANRVGQWFGWLGVLAACGCAGWLEGLASAQQTRSGTRQPERPSTPAVAGTTAGKSSPEALNLFADAASFQNNGAFELAAEEWEKFLQQFPRDPLASKARHYAGVCQLQRKNWEAAAAHFQAVLTESPQFELAEETSLNLGWCQYSLGGQGRKEMYERAVKTLRAHVEKYPTGKAADQAHFYLAESWYAQGKKEEAAKAYLQVVKEFPKSKLRQDALYALGVAQEESRQFRAARGTYTTFLKEFPRSDLVSEVRMRTGETWFQEEQFAEAAPLFAAVADVSDFALADYALLRQAECAARQEKFAEAAKLYERVAARFPQSKYLPDAAMAAGRSYYRAGQSAAAAASFRRALDLGVSDRYEAAHWLCRLHLQNKQPQAVITLAEEVLAKPADSPFLVHLRLDQADALSELAEWKAEASERYRQIVAEHPRHELAPQALYSAAYLLLEQRQFEAAARLVQQFSRDYQNDRLLPDALRIAAEAQLQLANYSAASTAFQQLLDKYGKHAEADRWRLRQGLAEYLRKDYPAAQRILSAALPMLKEPEEKAEAYYLVGVCQLEQGRPEEALRSLHGAQSAAATWRQADEVGLAVARAHSSLQQHAEAVAALRQWLVDFPRSKLVDQAQYRLGEALDATGEHAAAAEAYDRVVRDHAQSSLVPHAAYGKGWALLRQQQHAAAIESFSRLLQDAPQHPLARDSFFARAMCLRQTGKYAEALADLEQFLKLKPEASRRADALYERGLVEAAEKRHEAAATTFAQLLEQNPAYPQAAQVWYELAWARKNAGQSEFATAFIHLTQEFREHPLAVEAWYQLGEDHYENKRFTEAIQAYTAAAPRATGELAESVVHKLGWSYFRLGDFAAAAARFHDQVRRFPQGSLAADARFMQAECLFKKNNHQEAWPAFEAAIKTPAGSPQMQALAYLHGAQSAAQLQQWQSSVRLLDLLVEKFPESAYLAEALYERGWSKQNLKQTEAAVADYELAASKSRGEVGARARFMIGEIQFERKDHEGAVKSFLRVMYGYGGDSAPEAIKNWQGSAGYEAGRCAEVRIPATKDSQTRARLVQDARTYYTYVIERHPQHKLASQAKERLNALTTLR